MKDIEIFDKVMKIKESKELNENSFCWLYPFTNENIDGYYSKIDIEDKKVLAVTASGDHAFNALLYGAKEIETFDINPLAKYYSELKVAGIKSLSLEEFLLFFYSKRIFKSKYVLNKKIYYNKIRGHLSNNYQIFWDYVFENYSKKDLLRSYLFNYDYLDLKGLIIGNPYLREDNYNKLKDILNDKNIIYHDLNINELNKLNKKYDLILLSNIPMFIDEVFKYDSLNQLKNIIDKIKGENGVVVLNYFYDTFNDNVHNDKSIYNHSKVNATFPKEDYKYIIFDSSYTLSKSEFLKKLYNLKDRVLISDSKKNIKK